MQRFHRDAHGASHHAALTGTPSPSGSAVSPWDSVPRRSPGADMALDPGGAAD